MSVLDEFFGSVVLEAAMSRKASGINLFDALARALARNSPLVAKAVDRAKTIQVPGSLAQEERKTIKAIFDVACERAKCAGREADAGDLLLATVAIAEAAGHSIEECPEAIRLTTALDQLRAESLDP